MATARLEPDHWGPVTYRPMDWADLDEAVEIERLCFQTPWGRDALALELERPRISHYVVAIAPDGRIAGFAGMWVIEDEGHIGTVGVRPDQRRRGIGDGLVRWLVDRSRELGVRQLTLEVRESNDAARRLYEKYGFAVVGIRRGYYKDTREDALVMLLTLDDRSLGSGPERAP